MAKKLNAKIRKEKKANNICHNVSKVEEKKNTAKHKILSKNQIIGNKSKGVKI